MVKKAIWLVVSCLMALSLVMASCGPAAEEEEEEVIIGEEEEEEEEEEKEEEGLLPPEVPKYGGTTIYENSAQEPLNWDPTKIMVVMIGNRWLTHDELISGDWAKGPAGTGEADWIHGFGGRMELMMGNLCTSWEMPDDETVIFNIRQGVHWQNKDTEAGRFVGGRELTADDIVWGINSEWFTPGTFLNASQLPVMRPTSVKALDKYTVEVKFAPEYLGASLILTGGQMIFNPPELYEKYGDLSDWRNQVGTGPFILTDYVRGSSASYERNPNYHLYDPLHPENQLPYLDNINELYIPDASTRLAAFRTGKLDRLTGVSYEDAALIMDANPEVRSVEYIAGDENPYGRVDKPELPFKDLKVRQAMNLAVDQRAILEDFYAGHGDLKPFPWPHIPGTPTYPMSVALEDMPEDVQMQFTYDPDKAKQLLTEAGYPDGFKTNIICGLDKVDVLSIVREYLLAVGIDMEIRPMESGVLRSIQRGRTHDEMLMGCGSMADFCWKMNPVRYESFDNPAYWEDPYTREVFNYVCQWVGKDDAKWMAKLKEWEPFILEQAIGIWIPHPAKVNIWWPWLQNYHGESQMGYQDGLTHYVYTWMDPELKKSMGY